MSYKVKITFPPGVTQEQINQVAQSMGLGPDNPPAGSISQEASIENGCVVFYEEWESKAAHETFVNEVAGPAAASAGLPMPEIKAL